MDNIGNNDNNIIDEILDLPKILFIGSFGSGKTSIINYLTNSNFITSNDTNSCTQFGENKVKLKINDTNYAIIDTPGFMKDEPYSIKAHLSSLVIEMSNNLIGMVYVLKMGKFWEIDENIVNTIIHSFKNLLTNRFILIINHSDSEWRKGKTGKDWLDRQPARFIEFTKLFSEIIYFCAEKEYIVLNKYNIDEWINQGVHLKNIITKISINPVNDNRLKNVHELLVKGEEKMLKDEIDKIYTSKWYVEFFKAIPFVGIIAVVIDNSVKSYKENKFREEHNTKYSSTKE